MKKHLALSILVCCLVAFALTGCNQGEAQQDLQDGENVDFTEVQLDAAPTSVQDIAKKSEGKTEFTVVREGTDFYVLLSAAADVPSYAVEKIVVQENGDIDLLAINMRTVEEDAAASSVHIYKVEKMTFENGVIFQMAADPALQVNTTDDDANDDDQNANNGSTLAISIQEPAANSEVGGGSLNVRGNVEGNISRVKCTLTTEDGTLLGEAEAQVADLSKEYSAKLNYTFPDDFGKEEGVLVPCTLKVVSTDNSGVTMAEESITVQVK